MKTLGLIGGMSWESTVPYYRLINQRVRDALGGLHSAPLILHSLDFAEIAAAQRAGDWTAAAKPLIAAARALEAAGAEGMLICTNTMHKVADQVAAAVSIPLLHIGDATGQALRDAGHRQVGLLGTRFTMEDAFLRDYLRKSFALNISTPHAEDRATIHRIIFDELCQGRFVDASRVACLEIVARLADQGAEAVILGCTEIGLLLEDHPAPVPLFDTTTLHAQAAAL